MIYLYAVFLQSDKILREIAIYNPIRITVQHKSQQETKFSLGISVRDIMEEKKLPYDCV